MDKLIEEALNSSQNASDAEIEESENLKKRLIEKHHRRSAQLSEIFRTRSKEDLTRALEGVIKSDENIADKMLDSEKTAETEQTSPIKSIKPGRFNKLSLLSNIRDQIRAKRKSDVSKSQEDLSISDEISIGSPRKPSRNDRSSVHFYPDLMGSLERPISKADLMTWEELKEKEKISEHESFMFFAYEWPKEKHVSQTSSVVVSEKIADKTKAAKLKELRRRRRQSKEPVSTTPPDSGRQSQILEKQPQDSDPLLGGLYHQTTHDLLINGVSNFPSSAERIAIEKIVFYEPTSLEIPLEIKTIGKPPRYLEDEGIYVGKMPLVMPSNIRKLENRVLQEALVDYSVITKQPQPISLKFKTEEEKNVLKNAMKSAKPWFGVDGRITIQSEPLRLVSYRPVFADSQFNPLPTRFETDFLPPLDTIIVQRYLVSQNAYMTNNDESEESHIQNLRTMNATLARRAGSSGTILPMQTTDQNQIRLEVELQNLCFQFHPLFTDEHVYAENLIQLYAVYTKELARDQISSCKQRDALEQLKGELRSYEALDPDSSVAKDCKKMIQDYQNEIAVLIRAKLVIEGKLRSILKAIIRCWRRIKESRIKNRCINTKVRLKISKEKADKLVDQFNWNDEVDSMIWFAKKIFEEDYESRKALYTRNLKEYKEKRRVRAAALKRQKRRESAADQNAAEEIQNDAELLETERDDSKVLAESIGLSAPTPPEPFNEEDIRQQIVAEMEANIRLPGESYLHIELDYNESISTDATCPRKELDRRSRLLGYKYCLKLLYNNKVVDKTEWKTLSNDFVLSFSWIYTMHVSQYPDSIVAMLYEQKGGIVKSISEIHIPNPTTYIAANPIKSSALNLEELKKDEYKPLTQDRPVTKIAFSYSEIAGKLITTKKEFVVEEFDGSGEHIITPIPCGYLRAGSVWVFTPRTDQTSIKIPGYFQAQNTINANKMPYLYEPSLIYFGGDDQNKDLNEESNENISRTNFDLLKNKLESILRKLDPNDSEEAKLLEIMRLSKMEDVDKINENKATFLSESIPIFRLDHLIREYEFCDAKEIEDNKRFRVLQLRDSGVPEFRAMPIPMSEKEIPRDIFKTYEQRIGSESYEQKIGVLKSAISTVGDVRGMQAFKRNHDIYIAKLRIRVMECFQKAIKRKTLSQMVVEEKLPTIITLIPMLLALGEARRPLRPMKKERKQIALENLRDTGLEILITIRSAYNLPTRKIASKEHQALAASVSGTARDLTSTLTGQLGSVTKAIIDFKQHMQENILKPYVEVQFRGEVFRTPVAEGTNPKWNSELRVPFMLPIDLVALDSIEDVILISVYDEIIHETQRVSSSTIDRSKTQGSIAGSLMTMMATKSQAGSSKPSIDIGQPTNTNATVIQRIERRWIGGIELPFTTVYGNLKVDGKLRLSIPVILMGYEINALNPKSYLSLYVTLEPCVQTPEPLRERLPTFESEEALKQVNIWCKSANKKRPEESARIFKATVMNSNCQEVLACRYLTPLNPPNELVPGDETGLSFEESIIRLAKYVSLIPFAADSVAFPGLQEIWCTSDQFLKMLCGDEEEHAILFACYLLHLEKVAGRTPSSPDALPNVFLCCGEALPEGKTTYVLYRAEDSSTASAYELWNTSKGECIKVTDVNSTMTSVWTLVSANNIWANIQAKNFPYELDWDINNPSKWLPLFNTKHSMKEKELQNSLINSSMIQPQNLSYSRIDEREIQNIRYELESVLREALMEWRPAQITRMNYEYVRDLQNILTTLENNVGERTEEIDQVIERISSKYHVYGLPINVPYMPVLEIVERVKSRGIHLLSGPKTKPGLGTSIMDFDDSQFGLAVYVKDYSGPVLSIWIYLIALWRK